MENNAVYYGKPLDYDPDFRGPIKERRATDVVCLYMFLSFVVVWFCIGIYAFVSGNPGITNNNFNITDITCSTDKPYLFYIDVAKCKSAPSSGCNSTKVCIEECPDKEFVFNKAPLDFQWVICINNIRPKDNAEAELYIANDTCTLYYFPSRAYDNVCVPTEYNSTTIYNNEQMKKRQISYKTIDDAVTNLKMIIGFDEIYSQIVQDLSHAWPIMLGALGIAIVATIIYILLMRWIAGIMIWISFLAVAGLLIACIVFAIRNCLYIDELYPNLSPEERDAQKTSNIFLAIFCSVFLVTFLIIFAFLRRKIFLAIGLIKESSKAVGSVISALFFPIIPSLIQLTLFLFGVCIAVYLASIGENYYVLNNFNETDCVCSGDAANYTSGGECLPEIFAKDCHDAANVKEACAIGACSYAGLKQSPLIAILHSINVVAIYWVLFFMTAFMEMVIAGTFARWYFTMPKSELKFWIVSSSLWTTIRYHLGTIAFGSFIITVVRLIRMLLDGINRQLRESQNAIAVIFVSCCECFFSFLERVLKFISRNAYILCSIHGDNFCNSTKEATSLVMRNLTRVFVLDNVTDFLLFISKFLITLGIGCITYEMLHCCTTYQFQQIWFPILIMIIIAYLVATVFFNVYSMTIDTLFICYLEDIERNDGTPDKPYFMSSALRAIFEKQE